MFSQDGVLGYYTNESNEKLELYIPSGIGSGTRTGSACSYEAVMNPTIGLYSNSDPDYTDDVRTMNLAKKIENEVWIPNIGFNAVTGEGWFAGKNISFKKDGSAKIGNDTSGLHVDSEGNVTIGRLDFDSFVATDAYANGSTVIITPMSPNVFIEQFEFGESYDAKINLRIENLNVKSRGVMKSIIVNNSDGHIEFINNRFAEYKFIIPPHTTQELLITTNKNGEVINIYPVGGSDPYYKLYEGGIRYYCPGSKHPHNTILSSVHSTDGLKFEYFSIFNTDMITGICDCSEVGNSGDVVLKVYKLNDSVTAEKTEVDSFTHTLTNALYCLDVNSFKDNEGAEIDKKVYTNCTISLSGTGSAGVMLANNIYG
jgi:hypothetical protein